MKSSLPLTRGFKTSWYKDLQFKAWMLMADLQDLAKAFAYGLSKFTLILSIVCFVVALLAMIVLPGFDVEALEVIADKTFRVSFVAIIVSTICMLCLHKSENNDDCY